MWVCYEYDAVAKDWLELGGIDLPQDCFGDELYEFMEEMDWIDNMDYYDVAGSSTYISVEGNIEGKGKLKWEWKDENTSGN